MKKGELVVKVISGAGCETATIEQIEGIKKKQIRLVHCEHLLWDADSLREIAPVIPGFYSRLIMLDDGEEERIRKGFGK